ncbi:acyl-CoA dehydrogenase family protein [Actinocorallia aurantiaca]|uniref:Acyl-CoA dehydrogenase family protein n=1 Tax=Actinocorallia aurantiaca TaxID=46204 RepID=A0ABN3UL81_9ACTN
MDIRYSVEQRDLRDAAAQVTDRLGVRTVGQLEDAGRTARLDAAVADSGWRELRTADGTGAPWASGVEVAIIAEALARRLADVAFLGPTLAAELRRLAGAPEAGTRETVALRANLSGLAAPGENAVAVDVARAESALVLGPDGALSSVVLAGTPTGVDLTRPTMPVSTSSATPVGGPLTGEAVQRWTALALAMTAADLVGTMQGAVDLSVGYAKVREQYGRPIGSFQAVQHLLADAVVHLEGSRTASLHAAWAVDALEPAEAVAATASAKAYATRAAMAVHEIAIQVHGGIGNTWECSAHLFLRRALLASDIVGGVGPNLSRVLEHAGLGGAL